MMENASESNGLQDRAPFVPVGDADFARWLLQNHSEMMGSEALAATLFLLDCVVMLRDMQDRQALTREVQEDDERELQRWQDWLAYVSEVYFGTSLADASDLHWTGPLPLRESVQSPLLKCLANEDWFTRNASARAAVMDAGKIALKLLHDPAGLLQDYENWSGKKRRHSTTDQHFDLIILESADAPLPLDWNVVESIRSTLEDVRIEKEQGGAERVEVVNVFRWTLSTILEQHYGSELYGPKQDGRGHVIYATSVTDDLAIRGIYSVNQGDGADADAEETMSPEAESSPVMKQASARIRQRDAEVHAAMSRSFNRSHRSINSEPLGSSMGSSALGHRRSASMLAESEVSSLTLMDSQTSRNSSTTPLMSGRAPARMSLPASLPSEHTNDRPFSDYAIWSDPVFDMPPTSNALSSGQRRDLVKRSRKLQSMLGATLDEDATQKALVDVMRPSTADTAHSSDALRVIDDPSHHSQSFPAALPDQRRSSIATLRSRQLSGPDVMSPSPETPYTQTDSDDDNATTDTTSPEMDLVTPNDFEAQRPWGNAHVESLEADARLRDERRRRVAKLQRVLGERIPAELISGGTVGVLQKDSARRSPSKLETAFSRFSLRSKSMDRTATDESEKSSEDVEFSTQGKYHAVPVPTAQVQRHLTPEQTVASIRKARKLENLFGQLPPAGLYEPRFVRPLQSLESDDDLSSIPDDIIRKRRSSASTVAALLHLHDNDPASLDDVVQSLAVEEPVELSAYAAELSPISPANFTQRAAVDKQRHYARASKLARIFGTTRGDVLKRVLEDLEQEVLDDDDASDEEREEVQAGIRRLRNEAL